MKLAFVILFFLGAASANPTSSMSESTEEINTVDHTTSESVESNSSEQVRREQFATGETGTTVDNSQGSTENIRKNWIRVFSPQEISSEDDSTPASMSLISNENSKTVESHEKKSTSVSSSSESSESTESSESKSVENQEKNTNSSSSESSESSESIESHEKNSNSSSSESAESKKKPASSSSESNSIENKSKIDNSAVKTSSESNESAESTESKQHNSNECQPGADCGSDSTSDEYDLQSVGDDGASDPLDGFHVPDSTEREVAFKR
ncbi:hypothetical protein Baya_16341 [Bagarius yarrelli]|uniref:Dentin sialophosphoprotein-like n=1 Tax=Bagarius yarrelli TaxID=175774 RepID=A0A556VVU0_BAGYA|nr:hypothetical protein Baya_16341 [Bagarius yarrelli]